MADRKRRDVALPAFVEGVLDSALERALQLQRPVVIAYLDRVRGRRPAPIAIVAQLERRYLAAVTVIGAASGGAAAVPGVGTATSVASAALEITAFVEATALFTLARAEVQGLDTRDPAVRRALVLAVLLGESGAALAESAAVAEGAHWGQLLAGNGSKETVRSVNQLLAKHLLARFGTRQGALVVGRALPLGIGASIGAGGNAMLGRASVRAARRVFGPPPAQLPPRIIDGSVVEPAVRPPEIDT